MDRTYFTVPAKVSGVYEELLFLAERTYTLSLGLDDVYERHPVLTISV